MKKLTILLLALGFLSCSTDSIETPQNTIETNNKCSAVSQLIQVTIDGRHIIQGETPLTIDCSKCGDEYAKVYTGDRLIQYKKYVCQ